MKIDLKVLKESFYILLIVMIPIAVIAIYYYNPQDDIDESVELAYREMIINDILDPIPETSGDIQDTIEPRTRYDFSKDQERVIRDIIEICRKRNFKDTHVALMLAIADIESNFLKHPNTNKGKYTGLFQIDKNYNDNKNIEKTINWMLDETIKNKEIWTENEHYGFNWSIEYYYLVHQQGKYGFKTIYKNQNKKIQNMPSRIRMNICNNPPRISRDYYNYEIKISKSTKVGTWMNAWSKIVNDLTKFYLDYI